MTGSFLISLMGFLPSSHSTIVTTVVLEQKLEPSMKIIKYVDISPKAPEWERRYILHGIQQGWVVNALKDGQVLTRRVSTCPQE